MQTIFYVFFFEDVSRKTVFFLFSFCIGVNEQQFLALAKKKYMGMVLPKIG